MPADGSIIIDTRINKKGAEADLKLLQAKAKSTAQQISALDKELSAATNKRSKLADDLEKAQAAAEATAQELDKVNERLDASRNSKYGIVNDKDAALSDKLATTLQKQDEKVASIDRGYQQQLELVSQLESKHAELEQQLARENKAVQAQTETLRKAAEAEQRAAQFQSGDDAMQSYFAKMEAKAGAQADKRAASAMKRIGVVDDSDYITKAENIIRKTQKEVAAQEKAAKSTAEHAARSEAAANALSGQDHAARGTSIALSRLSEALAAMRKFGTAVFRPIEKGIRSFSDGLKRAQRAIRSFNTRLMSIVSGALVFNLISAGLRNMTNYMGQALTASGALRTALGNLAGAAQTAAAPLIQVLTPALAALANAAATVFSYIAQLVAFLTGTTVSAAQQAAAGVASVGSAASGTADQVKKATKSLAGFDEITRLDAPQDDTGSGGGGGSSAIAPNFDFTGKSPFLDTLLAAIEAGQWFRVGRLIGEKLRDSLNAIPWPDIQARAVQWATNIADTINGAVTTPGLWEAIGHTLAQGLNTVTGFVDTFFQGVWWADIGAGLARGLTQLVAEVDWPQLGRMLKDGMRASLLVLHGFVTTYTGWADLGMSIAAMIGAALSNIDWVQAAGDLGQLAIGILTAINTGLAQIDWGSVGQTLLGMLAAIDWAGLFSQLGQLFANTWPLILTTVVLPAIVSWVGSVLMKALTASLVTSLSGWITSTVLPAIGAGLTSIAGFLTSTIAGWPVLLIAALYVVTAAIATFLVENWDSICDWFAGVWDDFVAAWNDFWDSVAFCAQEWWKSVTTEWTNFWNGIVDKFNALKSGLSQAWDTFWTGLSDRVGNIWDGIVNTVKGAVNSLIGFINGMISAVVGGLNSAIDALNSLSVDIPDWVPVVGGNRLGFSISHITAPQIPYLAQGAVIPPNREFMAVLGDQSHGTNVEAPLSTIQQAVAAVMQDNLDGELAALEAIRGTLLDILQAVYGIDISDTKIGKAANRYTARQAIITGRA